MIAEWRLLLATLAAPGRSDRCLPAVGIAVGLLAAVTYWAAGQLWPTNVALVLSMLATAWITGSHRAASADSGAYYSIFILLIKYNALMALSAANVAFALPPFFALGLIMIAAQAASRALVSSVRGGNMGIALVVGFAPAPLLGIPGLIGLTAAIVVRLGLGAAILRIPSVDSHDLESRELESRELESRERLGMLQQITEVCFYLGALAGWSYL